ncbi:acyl-CoA N-acyltransferase [Gymnopus androsaceus JB14]|uniref:Acyl-CoA N-acyltransferase n=1 Tax=Gymnopus androsaceus JB14 TaxID=1447944 RepID=A0A6A4HM13_9AGAR|nr:acyl-CoA N-acyltransferase [Gymnopus androsaceus JB14]
MFETDRLRLRAVREADFENLMVLFNHDRVEKMLTSGFVVPLGVKAEKELREMCSSRLLYVIIETKDNHEFVGFISLWDAQMKNRDARLGMALLPSFWGRGYATEVLRFIIDYAFRQLALHRVSLHVFGNNTAAIKVYNKVGFVQEGVQRKANWIDGKWQDVIWMAVLDEDWEASKQEGPNPKTVS